MKLKPILPALLASILTTLGAQNGFAESATFTFDGEEYYLRGDEEGIREYLTEGETFEDWTTLISFRDFTGIDDPRAYAQAMVENVEATDPDAPAQILENEEAGSYIVDFVLFSEDGAEPSFAEWNLWRIEAKGSGIEAVQYARRFYEITDSTADELSEYREEIVPQLAEFVDPSLDSPEAPSTAGAPSGDSQIYAYPDGDDPEFTMAVPSDWAIESDSKGAWIVSADKQFTTSVVVVDVADSGDAVNSIMAEVSDRYSEIEWSEPMNRTNDANGMIFQGNDGAAEDKGVKYKVGVYLYTKDGSDQAFVLSTWAPEATLMNNAAGIMDMLASAEIQ